MKLQMKFLRNISFPFVPVYYAVTWFRNKLYDLGLKKSVSYDFPVICVGNLSAGGTGKSPMIEYLVRLLKDDCKVATLSRGYKRKTQGFQIANEKSSAETIGDEPFQFYNKFKNDIVVAVDSDRQNGIKNLRSDDEKCDIILLDDAYQHRKVKAGLNILLTTYDNLYVHDFVLPTGNLREPKHGAERAHIIVVTKCPDNVGTIDKHSIIKQINPKPYQDVFFSTINYSDRVISGHKSLNADTLQDFTLVTGIANPTTLIEHLKAKSLNFEHLNYKDHHEFSENDILELEKRELIVTTEKDYMRLKQYQSLQDKLFYLPIVSEMDDAIKFNNLITEFVGR